MSLTHEEIHDGAVRSVIGHGIEPHKVFILRHLVLLRYGCQCLNRHHEWRQHAEGSTEGRRVGRYNSAHETHVKVEVTVTRQAEMEEDSELIGMWAERKRGGKNFIKSPTYKCYGTSGKNHTMRKEACVRTSDNIDVSGTYRCGTSGELREEKHCPPAK